MGKLFGRERALCRLSSVPSLLADVKLSSPRPKKAGLKVDKALAELKAKPLQLHESLERFNQEWKGAR